MSNEDQDFDKAISTIRAWHYSAIRRIVDDAIEACVGRVVCVDPAIESIARDAMLEGRETVADEIRRTHPTHYVGKERGDRQDAREFLQERIDEVTDGHYNVIHTFQAKCALLASDNEDAYQDEHGEPASTVSAAACMAMRADCWQLLDARSEEWEDQDCDDCGTTLHLDRVNVAGDHHGGWCHLHPDVIDAIVTSADSDTIEADEVQA